MKYKSKIVFFLCCFLSILTISCNTRRDILEQESLFDETEELTCVISEETTAIEIETVPPIDWNISTERYRMKEIDGKCYIVFMDEYMASDEDRKACQLIEIYFDSMEDMVQAFVNNNLTPDRELIVQARFPKTENGIALWRTDRLYNVTLPDGVEVSSMALHGETYDYFVKGEMIKSGWVSCIEDWTLDKARMYDWSKGATVTREEESTFDGVPCRIVEYYNSAETYRDIFIETEQNGKMVYMVLRYLLEDKRPFPERVSNTAPWTVKIFCEDNGVYYFVSLKELTETPTYEWLSSFGLTPYVPAASSNLTTE